MIARTWHGRVPTAKADAFLEYLKRTGLSDYTSTPGNRGVLVLRRTEGAVTHFTLTTIWDSIEAVQRFAGKDYTKARYYPEDDDYLLEREALVTHDEVIVSSIAGHGSAPAGSR
ncbi:MAG TPA: antibiotic biosynthesis monooxygenase [Thermoplasmata archaeon]|nr:antibiotic biosynthesis monooxygenase [Thermoplasmata archaeon]